ncbi:MAG: hypothetical protein DRG71_01445 [Deltaproteobacteria bacterium]|nr:MAG: hypothetical protein DRG71_01445 [Deltaproteobacteria bacterium]
MPDLNRLVQRIEQIPTLPIVSQKILLLLSDENVSLPKVASLIERDQALAVKILKVANSAFYGTLSKVSTIDHALVILGIEEVRSILLAFPSTISSPIIGTDILTEPDSGSTR